MKPIVVPLLAVAVLSISVPVFGLSRPANGAYVQSMDGPSIFYARCVPDGLEGTAGVTTIYRVRAEKDEVVDTYRWFSPRGVILGWTPMAGKVAVMSFGEPGSNSDEGVEISFHLGGQLLHSYTTSDLKALGIQVGPSVERKLAAQFKVVGCVQVPRTNEYDFVIESRDGVRLSFDILTGKVREK